MCKVLGSEEIVVWLMTRVNGYTLDANNSRFDAVAIDGGQIYAVGSTDELRLQLGARASNIVDLEGATVIPGLVDSHLHLSGVAGQRRRLDLTGVSSKAEMLQCIRDWSQSRDENEWILGGGWDENIMMGQEIPTAAELDEASGGRPLLLARVCTHVNLADGAALALAGVTHSTADLPDGSYGRDNEGHLNGLLYESAVKPIHAVVPEMTQTEWRDALVDAAHYALSLGLTAVHSDDTRYMGGFSQTWSTYWQVLHDLGVHLRVHELVDWSQIDAAEEALRTLPKPDEWLEIGAAKLFSDGSMGGRTAWLAEAYSDKPDWHGTPMYPPEELADRVRIAHEAGFAVAIHAIGDKALDTTLRAIEMAPSVNRAKARQLRGLNANMAGEAWNSKGNRDAAWCDGMVRDRVVHAELVQPELIRRMAALRDSLIIDAQPRFTVSDFPWITDRLGIERAKYVCAWKSLAQAGLRLCGGSDAPVEPLSPLLGIHAAVTRRKPTETGEGYQPQERLTPLEAVRLFTHDAVYATGREQVKGTITPGWLADLTILDRDIVAPKDVNDIRDAKVLGTIVNGDAAFLANGLRLG